MEGKKHLEETKKKIGLGNKGKIRSVELRKRISRGVSRYFRLKRING